MTDNEYLVVAFQTEDSAKLLSTLRQISSLIGDNIYDAIYDEDEVKDPLVADDFWNEFLEQLSEMEG